MKGSNKATVLSVAEKCKSILASNWVGQLNTIKADAKGSKEDIYSSKVKYIFKRGKPYIWVPEKELHNVNTIIDERGSFAVSSPFPGPLGHLLKSIKKLPARVAISGDVVSLKNEKAQLATETLKEVILSEERAISESSYTVSGVLSSANTSRSQYLQELLDGDEQYSVYKFIPNLFMFIDGNGGTHEVDLKDIETSKADPLASFYTKLIDGINQNEARRRALMLFCFTYMNANARDAYLLSVDRMGFDVLAKVTDGSGEFNWKQLRFKFTEEARDPETFCRHLVEMEEEAVKKVSSYSGLG